MDLLKLGREIGAEAERVRWTLRLAPLIADLADFTSAERPDDLSLWNVARSLKVAVDELAHPATPAPSSPSDEQP